MSIGIQCRLIHTIDERKIYRVHNFSIKFQNNVDHKTGEHVSQSVILFYKVNSFVEQIHK